MIFKLCHDFKNVTTGGVSIGELDLLTAFTPLGTTSNYSEIADLNALQITTG
jgi:hypothetical protein